MFISNCIADLRRRLLGQVRRRVGRVQGEQRTGPRRLHPSHGNHRGNPQGRGHRQPAGENYPNLNFILRLNKPKFRKKNITIHKMFCFYFYK
jgi:hypothetical protein